MLYCMLIIAFFVYGLLFWYQLATTSHMSAMRRRILRKVQFLTFLGAPVRLWPLHNASLTPATQ